MSDLIERDAAIDRINGTGYADQIKNDLMLILRLLPSAQPNVHVSVEDADCISRQAAIEAIEFGITYAKAINKETGEVKELFQEGNGELRKAAERIKQLPSAQPELIRCKDCKHGSPNGRYGCTAYHYRRYETHDMKPDDFCSRAERRTDE